MPWETFGDTPSKANKQAILKSIVGEGCRDGFISFSSVRALRYNSFVFRFKSIYTISIFVHLAHHEQYTIDKTKLDNI